MLIHLGPDDSYCGLERVDYFLSLSVFYRIVDREQESIRESVIHQDHNLSFSIEDGAVRGLCRVGGVDLSYVPETNLAYVAIAILSFPELKLIHLECEAVEVTEPYIPGYLAFRELPPIQTVMRGLLQKLGPENWPQVFLVDGNGQLHPRGAGIASHLGVSRDIPTIGCSKTFFRMDGLTSKMIDETVAASLQARSDPQPHELIVGRSGVTHGAALLSGRKTKNPIFVSVGHRIGLESALAVVRACAIYRVPEPIRLADKLSRERAQQHIYRS